MEEVRPARPEEAGALSDLALRSKGHWGYDEAFLELCREDLTLTPEDIATSTVFVCEGNAGLAGFYCLKPLPREEGVAVLDDLFVDPAAIGQGVGRRLWEHAVRTARKQGYAAMLIQSDPYAEGVLPNDGRATRRRAGIDGDARADAAIAALCAART